MTGIVGVRRGWAGRAGLVALVLVLAGLIGAEPATARPAQPAGECIDIARGVYTVPARLSAPDHPHDYGRVTSDVPGFDPILLVRFCAANGGWDKVRDDFPYDSPNVCVAVYPSEDGFDDVLTPLSSIDVLGIMPVRTDQDTVYCRSGDSWERRRAPGEDPPPDPDCMTVTRWVFTPPPTIQPPDTPEKIGRQRQVSVDERFTTTYCLRDGLWRLTEDKFPYSSPDECISVYYDIDDHGGTPPPDTLFPVSEVDDIGRIDSSGGAGGTANVETYCRDGDVWKRTARADDMPRGSYKSWAEECKTIYVPPGTDPPLRLDDDPANHGDTDLDQFTVDQIMAMNPRSLPTYCRSGTRWFRVDEYPLDEAIPRLKGRLGQPGIKDSCAVIRYPKSDNWPDVLPPNADPGYLGGYWSIRYPFDDTSSSGEYIGTYPVEHMYCYVNGRWRRGDKLTDCESAEQQAVEGLLPEDCWGAQLTGKYDIGYDGGSRLSFGRRITGWWTDLFFNLGKGGVQLSLWAVDWAFDFDLSKYDHIAILIGDGYSTNITKNPGFHLYDFAWLMLVAWCGIAALRGRGTMAAGEIAVSIIMVLLSMQLMAHRGDYMTTVWDVMDNASVDLLVAGQGKDPAGNDRDISQVVDDVQKRIHTVFVEQPYDYLNWGHILEDNPSRTNDCADTRNLIVAFGPHESDPWPREQMRAAGCNDEADFNELPTTQRLLGAVFSMVASLVVAFVLLAVSLTVVVAKFVALALFAVAPFAALTAILPGSSRRLTWLWATTLVQAVVAMIGMSLLLSLLLLGIHHLLDENIRVGLAERFFVMNLAVLAVALARRRMLAGGQAAAGRFTDNLTNVRLGGGGAAWAGPTGSAGANLLNIDRGLMFAGWAAGSAVVAGTAAGGRSIAQRGRERRAWRNTLKARLLGDRIHGVQNRTYLAKTLGTGNGPGPRGGTPPVAPSPPLPSGPGPSGPLPAGGTPGKGGPHPGGGSSRKGGSGSKPWRSPAKRAAKAARAGKVHDAAFWRNVDMAHGRYRHDMLHAHTPRARRAAEARYSQNLAEHRAAFTDATGAKAPKAPHPREAPAGNPGRVIQEVVVTEYDSPIMNPIHKVRDEIYNAWAIRRGQRSAQESGLT
ncbi:MAG TPA: hypothetical protein VFR26_01610 [Acidimicrobiales bacterium]|nr:hypothetical protein [Acidimicrobiales bacterium]